jgi:hypothetical protein
VKTRRQLGQLVAVASMIAAPGCSYAAFDAAYMNRTRFDGPGGVAPALRLGVGAVASTASPMGGLELGGRVQTISGEQANPRIGAGPSLLIAQRLKPPSAWALGGRAGVWFDGPSEAMEQGWIAPALDLAALRSTREGQAFLFGARGEWHVRASPFDATSYCGVFVGYLFNWEKSRSGRHWIPGGG